VIDWTQIGVGAGLIVLAYVTIPKVIDLIKLIITGDDQTSQGFIKLLGENIGKLDTTMDGLQMYMTNRDETLSLLLEEQAQRLREQGQKLDRIEQLQLIMMDRIAPHDRDASSRG